ncbi:adenylate cyclase type 3 [Hetaerina americana]|uniref:adenylate cyclase type 3 n=1 Tax=Hetaerina americana TaxID=62018 RepID=UPI003A7F2883
MAEEVCVGKVEDGDLKGIGGEKKDTEVEQVPIPQSESLKENGVPPGSLSDGGPVSLASARDSPVVVVMGGDEGLSLAEGEAVDGRGSKCKVDSIPSGTSNGEVCGGKDTGNGAVTVSAGVNCPRVDLEVERPQEMAEDSVKVGFEVTPPSATCGVAVDGALEVKGIEETFAERSLSFAAQGTTEEPNPIKSGPRGLRLLGAGGEGEDGSAPSRRPLSSLCLCGDAFEDPLVEHLYQSYSVKQKRVDVQCFLCASILLGIHCLITVQMQEDEAAAAMSSHGWSQGSIEVADIQEDLPGEFLEPTWGFRLCLLKVLTGIFLFTNAALLIWCRRYAGGGAAGCLGCCPNTAGFLSGANAVAKRHDVEDDLESGALAGRGPEKKRRLRDHSSPAKPISGNSPSKPLPGNPPREMISALAARVRRAVGRHRPPSSVSSSVDANESSGSAIFSWAWSCVPHVAWHLANYQLLAPLFLQGAPSGSPDASSVGSLEDSASDGAGGTSSTSTSSTSDSSSTPLYSSPTPRDGLPAALLLVFLLFAALPLRLRYCLVLSAGTCSAYTVAVAGLARGAPNLVPQVLANCLLLVTANILGLASFRLADSQRRRAFMQTSHALQMKLLLEEQSQEQERLLLSVLPEHVAVKMRQDLGSAKDGQFKKIYMSRHENVSILYADIVGFTAISSTYSASELVKILNELFARFDRLAERYQQLRIKILGDCYYCISGAPMERPDHALLCVRMGLSMVKAIEYVQKSTKSPVDMRVGIHTGAVLAGVLGQRQWQFDVYSKDVELANRMESSGLPGRVHISDRTLSFLDGQFEVEPGYGERREEALRIAGLKTYFIVKPECKGEEDGCKADGASGGGAAGEGVGGEDEEEEVKEDDEFKRLLRQDLINRDGHSELAKHINFFTLSFRDPAVERDYHRHRESFSGSSVLALPLVLLLVAAAQLIVLPRGIVNLVSTAAGFFLLSAFSLVMAAESLPTGLPKALVKTSEGLNSSIWMRRLTGIIVIALLATANLADMACCEWPQPNSNCTMKSRPLEVDFSTNYHGIPPPRAMPNALAPTIYGTAPNGSSGSGGPPSLSPPSAPAEPLPPLPLLERIARRVVGGLGEGEAGADGGGGGGRAEGLATRAPTPHPPTAPHVSSSLSYFTHPTGLQGGMLDLGVACPHPTYFTAAAVLILSASSLISHLPQGWKTALMAVVATAHCLLLVLMHAEDDQVDCTTPPEREATGTIQERYTLSGLLLAVTIALAFLNRHTEKASRLLFLWRREVEERRERASEMRRRNEALVGNVLPPHVASHFLGGRRRSHDELYSQSYAEVGVLFASMPNFSDFYSEETVNNQGLECLRFLNEVISDFDALLERPPFQDIIKIKTIGSTYMAASGLNPSHSVKPEDPHLVRWAHLALLVDFAFELKSALTGINEQSFNHFVLKMGINHGPITAGVIGARKPHYDIWGNSVNVASRMESTGKAGCIQVTEETSEILRPFGYTFEQRGLVYVKGKGQLMTYYLIGKESRPSGGDEGGTREASPSPAISGSTPEPTPVVPAPTLGDAAL